MCDTGSIMANQMDDLIESGMKEHDSLYTKIVYLEKKVKLMGDFLQPHELKVVEMMLKNTDHEKKG